MSEPTRTDGGAARFAVEFEGHMEGDRVESYVKLFRVSKL